MHYERRNVEALGKLRVLEPQLALSEAEYEKVTREVDKAERKNRAMLETARHYERQCVELKRELAEKSNYLKQTDAHKRRAELESKRNIEDHQRKLRMETERQEHWWFIFYLIIWIKNTHVVSHVVFDSF